MTKKMLLVSLFVWRIGIFVVAFLSPLFIPVFGDRFPYRDIYLQPTGLPHFLWSNGNFDGVHYLTIAIRGYIADFIQAFFPLYPIVVHELGFLLFDQYLLVAIFFSTVCFFLSTYFLKKLLQIDYSQTTVLWSILFLLCFPTSFYFGAVYTEGLFLLLVVLSFYFGRKGRWLLAGIFGGLASATRFAGIFLFPALLIEWWSQSASSHKRLLTSWPLCLIPLGLIFYMYYLFARFQDPFLFFHALPSFGTGRSDSIILLPQVFWRYLKILFTVNPLSLVYYAALLEFITTMVFGVLIAISFIKTRLSYALFSFLVFISPTFTGTLTSMPRYVLLSFSAFIVLGMLRDRNYKIIACLILALILIINVILFSQGYWVA